MKESQEFLEIIKWVNTSFKSEGFFDGLLGQDFVKRNNSEQGFYINIEFESNKKGIVSLELHYDDIDGHIANINIWSLDDEFVKIHSNRKYTNVNEYLNTELFSLTLVLMNVAQNSKII